MISQILYEIRTTKGTINLNELSQKLDIDRTALKGILQYLVRRGRLVNDDSNAEQCIGAISCGSTCSGMAKCSFVAKMPKTYSIPNRDQRVT